MKIGIYGSAAGSISEEIKQKAREIGRQIAKKGHTVITGACHGLPYEAVLGAHEFGGKCIGFSPAVNSSEHQIACDIPMDIFSKIIYVPKDYEHADDDLICKKYRNVSSVASIDAAIIIGGRAGTMNEFTIAYDLGKKIGVLAGSGGISNNAIKVMLRDIDKDSGAEVVFESEPDVLVDRVCDV